MTALATIHVALKQLGIDADDARDMYERQTGKRSLREMSPREHTAVIGELQRLGFKRVAKPRRDRAGGPYRGKLQALWIACWNLGFISDPSDAGLHGFVRRQTKADHTRFLHHHDDADAVIEALKARLARAGVDWKRSRFQPAWTQVDGYRIARAQFDVLRRRDPAFADYLELDHWVVRNVDSAFRSWEARTDQWIVVMNALGHRVRALSATA